MKIMVLVKQTPDTETKILLNGDKTQVDASDTKYIINPYDEFAVEEALKIKANNGDGEVIIASFGPVAAKERIIKALAMGADRGLLISNEGLENADSLVVAEVLATAAKKEGVDLVLCGKQGIDDDNMHIPTMVAEKLGWPHVNVVTKVDLNGKQAKVEREVEGGQVEVYDVTLPCVLGAHKSLNSPRYASLPGIMKAKKKPFDQKTPSDIGLNGSDLAQKQKVVVESYEYPSEKPQGKLFKDEAVEVMVEKVVKLLREEAKVL